MAKGNLQNWITAYTQDDVEFVLKWDGIKADEEICKELNITPITLKEIVNTNDTTGTHKG